MAFRGILSPVPKDWVDAEGLAKQSSTRPQSDPKLLSFRSSRVFGARRGISIAATILRVGNLSRPSLQVRKIVFRYSWTAVYPGSPIGAVSNCNLAYAPTSAAAERIYYTKIRRPTSYSPLRRFTMKKLAILLTLAVAFSLSAFAQTGTSGTSSTSGTGTETQTTTTKTTKKTKATKGGAGDTSGAASSSSSASDKGANSSASDKGAKQSQLTGCLAKDATGNGFMLTNGRYKQGIAVTSSEDMSAHVGHEVKLMGTWEKPTTDAAGGAGTKGHEMRSFTATKLNHIADTCKASAAAAGKKGKKGAAAAEKAPGF
jgi:hypothetical protein